MARARASSRAPLGRWAARCAKLVLNPVELLPDLGSKNGTVQHKAALHVELHAGIRICVAARLGRARVMAPKLRSASIFWAEKTVLLVDTLQVYALLWTMAQAWPWPAPWLKWTRFALAFNLDAFTLAQSGSAGSTGGSAVAYVRGGVLFSPWGQRSGYLAYSTVFCAVPLLFALFAQHSVRAARRGRAIAAAGRQWQRRNRYQAKEDTLDDGSTGWRAAAWKWAKSKSVPASASAPAAAASAQTLLLRQGTQEQLSLLEKQADAAEAEPAHLAAAEAAAAAAAEERADMLWAASLLGAYVLTLPLGSVTLRLLHCVAPAPTGTAGASAGINSSAGTVLLGDPSVRCWEVPHAMCTAFCACTFVSAALLVPMVVYQRHKQVVSTPNPRPRTALGLVPSARTACASCAVCCAEIGCGEWGSSGSHASSPVDAAAQHERCIRATELEYALGLNDDWSESNGWLFSSFTLPATRLWASSAALKLLALSVVYAPPLRDAHDLWALQAAIFFAAQLWWWWLVTGGVSPPEPPPPPAWVSAEAELRELQDLEQQVEKLEKRVSQENGGERAPARRRRPQSAGAGDPSATRGAKGKANQTQDDFHRGTAFAIVRRALSDFCRRGCCLSAWLPGSARGNLGQKSRWRHATAPWRWARPAAFRCASTAFLAQTLAYVQVIFAGIGLAKASGSKSALLVSNRLLGLLVVCGASSCLALALAWCHARIEQRDGCDNGLWCAPSPNAAQDANRPSKPTAKVVPAETPSAAAQRGSSSSWRKGWFPACGDRGWPVPRVAIEMFLHHSAPSLGSGADSGTESAAAPARSSAQAAAMTGGGRRGSTIASMVATAMVAKKFAGSGGTQGGLSSVVTGHAKWLVVLQAAQLLAARLRDLQPADAGAGAGAVGAAKEIEALLGLEVALVGDTGENADDAQAFDAVTTAEDQDAARTAAEEAAEIKADAADWTTACAIQRVLDELHDACDQVRTCSLPAQPFCVAV